jgi:starvation-inducible outer membrane lipoprotein
MKSALKYLLLLATSFSLASCVTTPNGTGSVENLKRQPGFTPLPNTSAGDFSRAAAHYPTGRHSTRYGRRGMSGY